MHLPPLSWPPVSPLSGSGVPVSKARHSTDSTFLNTSRSSRSDHQGAVPLAASAPLPLDLGLAPCSPLHGLSVSSLQPRVGSGSVCVPLSVVVADGEGLAWAGPRGSPALAVGPWLQSLESGSVGASTGISTRDGVLTPSSLPRPGNIVLDSPSLWPGWLPPREVRGRLAPVGPSSHPGPGLGFCGSVFPLGTARSRGLLASRLPTAASLTSRALPWCTGACASLLSLVGRGIPPPVRLGPCPWVPLGLRVPSEMGLAEAERAIRVSYPRSPC